MQLQFFLCFDFFARMLRGVSLELLLQVFFYYIIRSQVGVVLVLVILNSYA